MGIREARFFGGRPGTKNSLIISFVTAFRYRPDNGAHTAFYSFYSPCDEEAILFPTEANPRVEPHTQAARMREVSLIVRR